MKKSKPSPKPYPLNEVVSKVEEPYFTYSKINRLPASISDFSYQKFQKIAERVPFTLTDWANILHLSERTLQRYSKDNKNFEGIYVDRILQIEKLIALGSEVFTDANALYKWLKQSKEVMGETITFESLYHTDGIYRVLDQLGRIQQGVYA